MPTIATGTFSMAAKCDTSRFHLNSYQLELADDGMLVDEGSYSDESEQCHILYQVFHMAKPTVLAQSCTFLVII